MLEPLCCFLAFGPQACALGAAHLIHRLIQMTRDMETVQHVQSLTGLGRDDFQVGLPHVTAHKTQPDRKSTRLNSSHLVISYAVFCLKKKKKKTTIRHNHATHNQGTTKTNKDHRT